ncbi:hypothetical protein AOQ84DRAFT_436266 [Glonium stellatum]|uniref:Uncharacterized protein n=1 Tax=Glonium stellatum TaxID=574774 RepID=A0A8E2JXR4_9PEZI|nr:hypothetical protein AOQ84DRAFT_436266 [Glonium stellatum]
MKEKQKHTYLPYQRGIHPNRLRIGSLYLDPFNPNLGLETKRFEYQENTTEDEYWSQIKQWTEEEQSDTPYSLTFEASKSWLIGAAAFSALHADADREGNAYATIEGSSGRRLQIAKPLKFFKDEVFTQLGVEDWIREQLSIKFTARWKNGSWKAPDIWLVTGIQLITGGTVLVGSSKNSSQSVGAKIDAGIMQGMPTGQDLVSVQGSHKTAAGTTTQYGHQDERVWAAQFMQLIVEFRKSNEKGAPDSMIVSLKEIEDLGEDKVRDDESPNRQSGEAQDGSDINNTGEHVAEIVGVGSETASEEEKAKSTDFEVSDRSYEEAMEGIDWVKYDEHSKYLNMYAESEKA